MNKFIGLCLCILIMKSAAYANQVKSKYDFQTTFNNIKSHIQEKNIPIFAEFDHTQNAKDVGLELYPTKVIVFGNPKVGTLLMKENQAIGIGLPLKIIIWQDNHNNVFVRYSDIKALAKQYNIKNTQIIDNINALLKDILKASIL